MARKASKLRRPNVQTPRRGPAQPARGRRAPSWRLLAGSVGVFLIVFMVGLIWPLADMPMPRRSPAVEGGPAAGSVEAAEAGGAPARIVRVIDGDTVVLADGEHVRILNIDTPEMPPRSRCATERDLALAAKARLSEIVRQGDNVTLTRQGRDRDQYDRQLRRIRVDGQDVGEMLVREGLAQPWRGYKAEWC